MAINKVIYGSSTLIDLSSDTITPDKLAAGATAHDASGSEISGTRVSAVVTGDNLTLDGIVNGDNLII